MSETKFRNIAKWNFSKKLFKIGAMRFSIWLKWSVRTPATAGEFIIRRCLKTILRKTLIIEFSNVDNRVL